MDRFPWWPRRDDDNFVGTRRRLFSALAVALGLAAGRPTVAAPAQDSVAAARRKCGKRGGRRCKKVRVGYRCRPEAGPFVSTFSGPGGGDSRLAQVIVPNRSGRLVRARMRSEKEAGTAGDFLLQLTRVDGFGVPTQEVIAVARLANSKVPVGEPMVTFAFPRQAKVSANKSFALVPTRPGGQQVGWEVRNPRPCAGQVFLSPSATAPYQSFPNNDFAVTVSVES